MGLVGSNSTAQNIPDANFALYIQSQCPTCIDANRNLTAAAASVTSLDVSSGNISDLTGIVGFTNLQNLTCEFNPLTSLPTLPSNLLALNCSYNQLTSISNLPNSLQYLDCTFNGLTNLSNLPSSLQKLFCGANGLTSLPTLPNGLKELECNFNAITHLPNLPIGLEIMYCGGNSLTNLPVLPNSLTNLFCYDNQITNLPALPTNLAQLRCQNNRLTSLPSLPANFKVLYCEDNQLSNLPNLPTSLTYLSCSNNQIACLPTLPNSLTYLRIDADKVLCLPNAVANLTIGNAAGNAITLPTCAPTIVTHPSVNPVCSGTNQVLTAQATGVGTMTAKWQRKGASEANYSDVTPVLSYTTNINVQYTFTPTLADNGANYRVIFISTTPACSGETATNAAVLSVSDVNGTGFVIPNAHFRAAVKAVCPMCIDGCDKLTAAASTLETLNISSKNINDLTGIDKFLGLKQLNCSNNQLTTLPTLPTTLQVLNCQNNQIPTLPSLPTGLQVLNCANNYLINLPNLPNGLTHLNFSYNSIRCLPILPSTLQELILNEGQTQCLPNQIANLTVRNPSNSIISMPLCTPNITVHPSVSNPVCPNIQLNLTTKATGVGVMTAGWQRKRPTDADFTDVPNSYSFYTSNTDKTFQLTPTSANNGDSYRAVFIGACNTSSISNHTTLTVATLTGFQVPDANFAAAIRSVCPTCITDCNVLTNGTATLFRLDVSSKNISNLSGLEYFVNLRNFDCSNNNINTLPFLPIVLTNLYCYGNNIVCLPTLPEGLRILQLDNTKVYCLPNLPTNLTVLNPTGATIFLPSCAPTIVTHPSVSDTVCTVKSLSLTAKATGLGAMLVRWQRKAAAATTFSDIANSSATYTTNTNTTLTFMPTAADEGAQFRAVFTACNGQTPTNPLTLTITPSDIPDANFAAAIRGVCPNCIDACNNLTKDAESLTDLTIPNKNITDLTGIAKFKSLQTLNIFANKLTTLPSLPTTLTQLECGSNQLTSLPTLPNSLQKLFCQFNQLPSLPALPVNLQWLYCQNNQLTGLPSLPPFLSNLYCNNNQITNLPPLEVGLRSLYCHDNLLTSLPALPNFVQTVDCQNNQIYCLPTLPSTLRVLYVDADKVTCLPNSVGLVLFNGNTTVCDFSITQHPSVSSLVCKDQPLTLTAKATNGGFTKVKWQRKPFGTVSFTDVVGSEVDYVANSNATYTFTPTTSDASLQIQAVFTAACKGVLTTNIVKLDISDGMHIPDANFAEAIRDVCPTCINACDNLTAAAASLTSLNVSSSKIEDLTGIDGFSSLRTLNCSNNKLTNLPTLPTGLTSLRIENNDIYCLPTLPNSLSTLVLDANKIFCLPNVPTSLTTTLAACGIVTHPSVSGNPAVGQTINLSARANISGNPTVKWQRKGASDSNFSDINGTSTTYTSNSIITYRINSLASSDIGANFRAVFNSSCSASLTSNAAMLGVALPVELLRFSGNTEGGKNYLNWQTAIENGTSNFEIERSLDGQNFIKIGTTKAKGSNSDYTFLDEALPLGVGGLYYRLKINDLDGKTSYSKTISFENEASFGDLGAGAKIQVFPNPTKSHLSIVSSEPIDDIWVLNAVGQIVLKQKIGGQNQFDVDVNGLASGIYFIKTGKNRVKFVKN